MKKDIEITIDEMEAANHLHKTHGWALKEENVYNQEKDSVFFCLHLLILQNSWTCQFG